MLEKSVSFIQFICLFKKKKKSASSWRVAEVTHLKLRLKEELLRTLRAVVDFVLLTVSWENMLLELTGLDEYCTRWKKQI